MRRRAVIEWEIAAGKEKVWERITNNHVVNWRSDLQRVEILTEQSFIEYGQDGAVTTFEITEKTPFTRYCFTMSSKIFTGTWTGQLQEIAADHTRLLFSEDIHFRNPVFWLLSWLLIDLKKIQKTYMQDLQRSFEHDPKE